MDELAERLHRSWLELLLAGNYNEIAALVVEGEFSIHSSRSHQQVLYVEIPPASYPYIAADPNIRQIMETTAGVVATGYLYDDNGNLLESDAIKVEFRIKLLETEANWRDKVKELIVNAKDSNQGIVTEKVFARNKKSVIHYNEMKFGSQSEVRIAQELESRKVLFFPLPLAVRKDTDKFYLDHREPDFLICYKGKWGILEIATHSPDRYENDDEKALWFKASDILCVEHRPSKRCYENPKEVVDEFLGILSKHK